MIEPGTIHPGRKSLYGLQYYFDYVMNLSGLRKGTYLIPTLKPSVDCK